MGGGGAGADTGPDGGGRQLVLVPGEQVPGERVGAEQAVAYPDAVFVGEPAGQEPGVQPGYREAGDAHPGMAGAEEAQLP